VITLGRDEPSVRDAEQRAMAIWYDTKEPIGCVPEVPVRVNYRKRVRHYLMLNGGTKGAEVSVHPDARVQAIVEQSREAEMLQAIDRLRLIHTKRRKTVYIVCSIPLDIPVDELVTWKQLTGDRRLSDDWRNATRGTGMRCRWSKALVRHGAEARSAIVVGIARREQFARTLWQALFDRRGAIRLPGSIGGICTAPSLQSHRKADRRSYVPARGCSGSSLSAGLDCRGAAQRCRHPFPADRC